MRTIAVCQPYWAPYAGYFRLFVASDLFVVFDDVQFPRRGWVHRYKDKDGRWVSLPVAKAPRDTRICDMKLRDGTRLTDAVLTAQCAQLDELGIRRSMTMASWQNIDPALKGQDRVIALCSYLGATKYVNPSGGRALYDAPTFAKAGIELGFLKPYEGSYESILTRLQTERAEDIAAEIRRETVIEWTS